MYIGRSLDISFPIAVGQYKVEYNVSTPVSQAEMCTQNNTTTTTTNNNNNTNNIIIIKIKITKLRVSPGTGHETATSYFNSTFCCYASYWLCWRVKYLWRDFVLVK
jgi:hypothetical protein